MTEGTRVLLDASWAALYDEVEGSWLCHAVSGTRLTSDDPLHDPPPATAPGSFPIDPLGLEVGGEAALTVSLEVSEGAVNLLLVGPHNEGKPYSPSAKALLNRVAPDLGLALRKAIDLDQLRSQAFVDSLTSAYNRRGFDEHLHVELLRAQRYDRPLSLILVDLDAFKRINDELGHQAGDHVLRRFASLLTTTFRTTDVISRYGGDEFAVIFPETSGDAAKRLAERIRLLIRQQFPDTLIPRPVTASFGIATYPFDAGEPQELVARADRALYAAKTGGRDRVVAAEQRGETER